MEQTEEVSRILRYRFPAPRWFSLFVFLFIGIIAIPIYCGKAVVWFLRWIGRVFMRNVSFISYIVPIALAYFVAFALVLLFFRALYL